MQERGTVAALSQDTEPHEELGRATIGSGWRPRRLLIAIAVAAGVVVVDQVTKSLALSLLHGPVHLIGPLGLALGYNSGSAFSLFTGRAPILAVVAVVLIAALVILATRAQSRARAVVFGLVLGGAVGNLSDRVFRDHHGGVVDFITLTHWPTFNVADSCITVGIVLLVLMAFRRPPGPEAGRGAGEPTDRE